MIGFVLGFISILEVAAVSGFFAFVLFLFNVGHLFILVGLWHMRAAALTWAYVFYGLGLLLDLVTLNLVGALISIVILGYLVSIAHKFR